MTDRKQVRIGQPVCVLTNGSSAVRTKICQRIMRRKTAVTQRNSLFFCNLGRDIGAPRLRSRRPAQQPSNQRVDSVTSQGADRQKTKGHLGVGGTAIDLSENSHLSLSLAQPEPITRLHSRVHCVPPFASSRAAGARTSFIGMLIVSSMV